MKICYLTPARSYAFFHQLVPRLKAAGHEVHVNAAWDGADLVIATMLPQTERWVDWIRAAQRPTVLWHWDHFSFTDYAEHPGWAALFEFMSESWCVDIWCATYEVCRQLRKSHGYESWMVGSWVTPEDFGEPPYPQGDYVLYAAPPTAFHKRLDWADLACRRLGLPFRSTYQHDRTREQYCRLVRDCRVYVMPCFEESNATIPALEAALCGKPIVASDLPAVREELGDTASYFKPWDFGEFLERLSAAWHDPDPIACAGRGYRVSRMFSLDTVANRIIRRINALRP